MIGGNKFETEKIKDMSHFYAIYLCNVRSYKCIHLIKKNIYGRVCFLKGFRFISDQILDVGCKSK